MLYNITMKIVIASAVYYPMINGVATFTHNLAEGLAKRGNEVMVICPSFTGKKHQTKEGNLTVSYLNSIRLPVYPDQINEVPAKKKLFGKEMPRLFYRRGFWVSPAPQLEIRKLIKKFNPDVIHSQTCDPIGLAISHYAKEFNIPLITTGHTYPDTITRQLTSLNLIKKPLDAALTTYLVGYQRRSDYATMPTELAIEDLILKRRRKFKPPIEALSNGVDLSSFKPGRANIKIYEKYKLPTDRKIVLYVGRVDPEKSISRVVEAFAIVLEKIPDAVLAITGDGADRAHLQELVKYLQIEKSVIFLGRVMPPELQEVYKTGDVFATASEIETQGIVLIEACATGLPIVGVDAGAVKEVCQDGVNGVLCQPGGDINGIANGLIKILSNDSLRLKYGKKSLEIAAKHDLQHTLERFEEIYFEAIKTKYSD